MLEETKKLYKKAYIEITNRCNFACPFCAPSKREKRDLSLDEFNLILEQVKNESDYVYLHVLGEPLLNADINEMLTSCEEKEVFVNLTTNGSLIGKLKIGSAVRKVSVSLNSLESNKIDLEKYFNALFEFIDNTAAIIELRLFSHASNESIIDILSAKFKVEIENGKKVKLRDKVYLEFFSLFKWPGSGNGRNKCLGLIDQFAVLVNGEVVPCCVDYDGAMPLGNIFKTPLKEILHSEKAEEIRDGFKNGAAKGELCKKCSFSRDKVF